MLVFYWLLNKRILLNEQEIVVLPKIIHTLLLCRLSKLSLCRNGMAHFFFLVEPRELLDLRLSASADNTDSSWGDCVIGTYVV